MYVLLQQPLLLWTEPITSDLFLLLLEHVDHLQKCFCYQLSVLIYYLPLASTVVIKVCEPLGLAGFLHKLVLKYLLISI